MKVSESPKLFEIKNVPSTNIAVLFSCLQISINLSCFIQSTGLTVHAREMVKATGMIPTVVIGHFVDNVQFLRHN